MTLHLTIWWLWWFLIALYALIIIGAMMMTMLGDDDPEWWERPLILIWPVALLGLALWGLARFMAGKN